MPGDRAVHGGYGAAGQKLGEGRPEEGGQALGNAIALFAAVALLLTRAMVWAASPMARLMQAPAEAFAQMVTYVRICSGGAVFIAACNVLGAMFRGIGDSQTPLLTVSIACVVNIAGDLALVGACGLGVAGAALATVLAQAASVALSLVFTYHRGLPFSFSRQIRHDSGYRGGIFGAHPRVPVHEPAGAGVPVPDGLATPCSALVQIALFLGCYAFTAARDRKLDAAEREPWEPHCP